MHSSNTELLILAAKKGNSVVVRDLLATVDARANDSAALRWAAANGHVECVTLLLPVSEPAANDSQALVWAAMAGAAECVRVLLPFCEVEEDKIRAISSAVVRGRFETVEVLYDWCDPNRVLQTLSNHQYASYYRREIARFQELMPQKQKEVLEQVVGLTPALRASRKL